MLRPRKSGCARLNRNPIIGSLAPEERDLSDLGPRWQTQGPQAESGPPLGFIQPAPYFYLVAALSFHLTLRSSYIYTVLKLHSAL